MLGNRTGRRKLGLFRPFRMLFAVVVLGALVLVVSSAAKGIYFTGIKEIVYKSEPLLSSLHIKIDEKKVGDVAGKFVERVSQTNLGSGAATSRLDNNTDNVSVRDYNKNILAKVALISDIHGDVDNLEKTLNIIKNDDIEVVFILGDITNYGDLDSLEKVNNILKNSEIRYYALSGDHDIAQTSDLSNFLKVFGNEYNLIDVKGVKFLLFGNSFNYTKIPVQNISWLENNITKADFILLSQPVYTSGLSPFFEKIYMGSTSTDPGSEELKLKQDEVRDQGLALLALIRSESGIKAVFAGEHHKSSHLTDSMRSTLEHYVVGAVTDTVNEYPQNIIQTPRFSVLNLYEDGSYKVEEQVIE